MNQKIIKKCFISALLSLMVSNQAFADIPPAPKVEAKSYVLMEYKTGKILNKLDENKKLAPASLTKVMTAYVVFDELRSGRLHLDDEVKISKKAWKTSGSRTFVREGTLVKVEDLIKGTIIQSGNDAATALAEHISGSTDQFAVLMNFHAGKLGMSDSHFKNPTGLPARGHYTTAKDLATLTRAIIEEFPDYYYIYQMKQFTYADITQKSRNRLLNEDLGFDGLKTGFTNDAGYCYIGASKRGDTRMIVTLLGEPSPNQRFEDAKKLVNYGFRFYETHEILSAGVEIPELTTDVVSGETNKLHVGAKKDLVTVLKAGQFEKVRYEINLIEKAIAPIKEGTVVGSIKVFIEDDSIGEVDLIALNTVEEGSVVKKLKDSVLGYF